MKADPLQVAYWRFEQISPLLEAHITNKERRQIITAMAQRPVIWPSGRQAPIPRSSLYRWLKAYQNDPRIESLYPKTRERTGPRKSIHPTWIDYALALLEEEPRRSLFMLIGRIVHRFELQTPPPRTSLHRALNKHPRYRALRKRQQGATRVRVRFQADQPHQIWQGDAKAEFTVRFTNGEQTVLRILTLLDDATRFVLRALIVESESLAAAVATFRHAGARYGLCERFYADRASCYDSYPFRRGLGILGVRRIPTKPRNPSAHGKIEAYHRSLQRWFINELKHQPIRDLTHLQHLLDAVIEQQYQNHTHRELGCSPREAFAETISSRTVSLERLREAFFIQKQYRADPRTHQVRINRRLFKVDSALIPPNRYVKIAIDPEDLLTPYLVTQPGHYKPLQAAMQPALTNESNSPGSIEDEPVGSLTPLLEHYRGRKLPLPKAGFGLPEIYHLFSQLLDRQIPQTEEEAARVAQWLADHGPFDPRLFERAIEKLRPRMGSGRPLVVWLEALRSLIHSKSATPNKHPKKDAQ